MGKFLDRQPRSYEAGLLAILNAIVISGVGYLANKEMVPTLAVAVAVALATRAAGWMLS